ncbi:MAG: NAD(P)/FAD-dependent oxidoreductase [Promethearchaeota archaeon]|nr:MAG: NAD(P)/FAD-dependent oxidoreductase [Candidatus Lokiarchaeota archaeon]
MKSEIIVAGAGHGGLITSIKLAKKGYDVHIFERKKNIEDLSWDWCDIFDYNVFDRIKLPKPDNSLYEIPINIQFVSPDEKHELFIDLPVEKRGISMERKILIKFLIEFAKDAGVNIHLNERVDKPVIKEKKIIGLKLKTSEVKGDLIIDSAGINTPIRTQLPENYGLNESLKRGEVFHTYRAYYNKLASDSYFKVCLGYNYKRGISWVNTSEEYVDVLIGYIDHFTKEELNELINSLKFKHSAIGNELLRGGIIEDIPIRRTAPMLVGDNYAVIGDAAFMATPISGSGIANSMIAGDILSNTIINIEGNTNERYDISKLWPYQVNYYQEIGCNMAFIEVIRNFMIGLKNLGGIDFLFEKKIITASDITSSLQGNEVKIKLSDLLRRGFRGLKKFRIVLQLAKALSNGEKARKHFFNIPEIYDNKEVKNWSIKGNRFFTKFYKKMESIPN